MSSNFTVKRICEHCEGIFDARTTVTRFCGPKCSKRNYKQRQRAGTIAASVLRVRTIMEKPIRDLQAREFLRVRDVAELLGTSTKMIYRMIREGELGAINLSVRKTIIPRKEIDTLFKAMESVTTSSKTDDARPGLQNSYSMAEAQKKFNISEAGLYQLIKRHNISKYKNGWYTYVAKKELDIIFNVGLT